MKKLYVILLLTAVVLGVLVFFLASPQLQREPEYQGKPLSFWLQQEFISPNNSLRLRLTPEASEAVRQIGASLRYNTSSPSRSFPRAIAGT